MPKKGQDVNVTCGGDCFCEKVLASREFGIVSVG